MDEGTTPEGRLAALGAHLAARKLAVDLRPDGLRVTNPQSTGCCSAHLKDTITCRRREDDEDRLWYFTSWGEPISPADRVIDAAVFVLGYLTSAAGR